MIFLVIERDCSLIKLFKLRRIKMLIFLNVGLSLSLTIFFFGCLVLSYYLERYGYSEGFGYSDKIPEALRVKSLRDWLKTIMILGTLFIALSYSLRLGIFLAGVFIAVKSINIYSYLNSIYGYDDKIPADLQIGCTLMGWGGVTMILAVFISL
ncbi:MAG: hypothetical protein PF549_00840 [Patescibacteria group bacterium]|nr:hypothetical protein [Patescibacteria group bacterium]